MNNYILKYLALLPFYVLLQILILNEVLFSSYINPFLYIILIISLPLKTPKWFLLIYAFLLGFLIDLLSANLGFHSTATVLAAFIKPFISKLIIPYNILAESDEITLRKIGAKAFFTFALFIILIHNSCLFIISHLDLNTAVFTKIIASSIITLLLVLITQLFQKAK